MKNVLLSAAFTSILFACNNPAANNVAGADTAGHTAHQSTASNQANEMVQTMDKMMEGMHAMKGSGNNEVDFATMMIAHHKGAVAMSELQMSKGSNPELKAFAKKIIDDQNKEIAMMQSFIEAAPKTTSPNAASFQKALSNSMAVMMNDSTPVYNNIDKDFAAQMIPHHQSAVDMAKVYLQYGKEKNLTTLSQNIVSSQTEEIAWLKTWLAKNM